MSDEQIIQAIIKGDISVFTLLVDKYQTRIFHTVLGFVHSKEDAEDLTQEVFVNAFQSISSFKGNSGFSTWLFRIAINIALNHIHKSMRNPLLRFTEELIHDLFLKSDNSPDPEELMVETERDLAIRNAIDLLPDKQRTAFVLSKYDELSQKEIAAVMNTSEGAVEQHLQRAKINLQKKLAFLVGK
jgi:RNA polymerase sigma-70 factor (ECF subfamily)